MQEPYLFIYFYDLRPFSPIYNGMRDVTPKLLKQKFDVVWLPDLQFYKIC